MISTDERRKALGDAGTTVLSRLDPFDPPIPEEKLAKRREKPEYVGPYFDPEEPRNSWTYVQDGAELVTIESLEAQEKDS